MYVSCQARQNEFYSMKLLQSLSNIITFLLVDRYVVANSYNFWKKLIFGHIHLYQRWSKLQRPWNFRRKLHRKTSFIVFDEKTAAYISWLLMRQRAFKQQNIDKTKFVIHCQFTFYDMHLRFSKYVDVIVMYNKNAAIYKWIVPYY